ncbi:sugar phosphate isomerase/epimerase [Candidatus Aerophobetes bacterium]|uniref:Sugar phosphate isomerase/epimerase n=1 Tax=Aerophobetes bacterium TaxID=2030807 RepID=A0A7V5M033_UNCAE|nr:sugar phosphate isomerase/epimerase [Candidatus Aerophobetes bacterium]HHF98384.1 sugar phosphate isomerase/epimerase [Candidatus Aerophobetes bacterium]
MKIGGVISFEETKFAPVIYKGGFEEGIRKLAEFGYDGVEISLRDPNTIDKDKLKKTLKENKISLASIATGQAALKDGLTFTHPDEKIREKAIERIMEQINFASEFSVPVILGLIRGNLPENEKDREKAFEWTVDACRRCCDFAREKNVTVCMEIINRYETNWLNTIAEGKKFLESVGKDNLLLHIDTFHMNIEESSLIDSILDAEGLIGYVHLVDSNRWAPGYGHIDFKGVLSALKKINYQGFLSLEVFPLPDPDTAAKKGIEFVRDILKSI